MSKRKLLSVLIGAISVFSLSPTASAYHMGETYHHGWNGGMGGGWFGFGMMFLWVLVLVAVVVAFVYWAFGKGKSDESESNAMEILRERYARGDIDEEEFRERRRSLTES